MNNIKDLRNRLDKCLIELESADIKNKKISEFENVTNPIILIDSCVSMVEFQVNSNYCNMHTANAYLCSLERYLGVNSL